MYFEQFKIILASLGNNAQIVVRLLLDNVEKHNHSLFEIKIY